MDFVIRDDASPDTQPLLPEPDRISTPHIVNPLFNLDRETHEVTFAPKLTGWLWPLLLVGCVLACEKTGRVCQGFELDFLYVDVIIRRYEAATGIPGVLAETGERFIDLAARRSASAGTDNVSSGDSGRVNET